MTRWILAASLVFSGGQAFAQGTGKIPGLSGVWSYDQGRGSASFAQRSEHLSIHLHYHPRTKRGEKEPHYLMSGRLHRDDKGQWILEGTWSCNRTYAMQGCDAKCSSGSMQALIESDKRVRITAASNQCSHQLSKVVLTRS